MRLFHSRESHSPFGWRHGACVCTGQQLLGLTMVPNLSSSPRLSAITPEDGVQREELQTPLSDVPNNEPPNSSPAHLTTCFSQTPTIPTCWEVSTVVIKGPPRDPRLRQKKLSAFGRSDYRYVRTLVKALERRRAKGFAFEEDDLRFLREVRSRIERDLKFERMVQQTKREMRQAMRKAKLEKEASAQTNSTALTR